MNATANDDADVPGWDFPLLGVRKVLRCQNYKARGLANVHEAWP